MRALCSLVAVATLLALTAPLGSVAEAQSAEARQRARQLYTEAQALFEAGNYAQAEASFRAAYEAVPNPVVLRAVASAQEHQGNIAGAIETLERYLEQNPQASDRAEVEGLLTRFRAQPAIVNISSTPAGAQILVDGRDTGQVTPADVSIPNGEHTVELRLAGHAGATQTFTAQAATRMRLELSLEAEAADPLGTEGGDGQAAEESTEPSDGGGGSDDPSAGVWVLAGIGAATLIAGTVFGFLALSEQSNFDSDPAEDVADRGEIFALVADIGFGVAGASVIAAIILYVVERAGADSDSAAIVAPFVTADGGAGVSTQLRF